MRTIAWAALALAACYGDALDEPRPPADAEALWSWLQDVGYRSSFELWPGTEALYEGSDPHGALLTTYVSPDAFDALEAGDDTMPDGACIVKENYTADEQLDAYTIMYKVEGFAPETGDWFWLERLPDGTVEAEGAAEGCIACHSARAEVDYLWTPR